MGYGLTPLADLPFEKKISLYIFVLEGRWKGGLNDTIEQNFMKLAEHLGPTSIIAKGFHSESWTEEILQKYLGKSARIFQISYRLFLISDAHPEQLNEKSLRLLVPLKDASSRFGGIEGFFDELINFVNNRDPSFFKHFQDKSSLINDFWSAVEIDPKIWGIGFNIKHFGESLYMRHKKKN